MASEQELRKRIMRSVYVMYVARQLTSMPVRIAAVLVFLFALISSVSLPNVIENALQVNGLLGLVRFSVVAFLSTTVTVQLTAIASTFIVGWSMVDGLRHKNAQLSVQ
ncbi:hypothetical protein EPO56_02005 [Patescibacteria group bacterium]|nr:MAG: hypothetical protein EPO56_02005 [Patescibacteria group bacterium]